MSLSEKLLDWRLKVLVWIFLPAIVIIGIVTGFRDLVPAWKAHNGEGVPGTFTARYEDCGRRSCTWHGTWVSTDGKTTIADTILNDEPDAMKRGDKVESFYAGGAGVYNKAGGSAHLIATGVVLAAAAALATMVFMIVRAIRRRREAELEWGRRDW